MGFSYNDVTSKSMGLKARLTSWQVCGRLRNFTTTVPGKYGVTDFGADFDYREIVVSCSIFPRARTAPRHKPITTDQNPLSRPKQPATRAINLISPAPTIRSRKNGKPTAAANTSRMINTAAPSAAAAQKPVSGIQKPMPASHNPTFPAPDTQAPTETASPAAAADARALLGIR